MDGEQQQPAYSVYLQVSALQGEAREQALRDACGSDVTLRHRVEALLRQEQEQEKGSRPAETLFFDSALSTPTPVHSDPAPPDTAPAPLPPAGSEGEPVQWARPGQRINDRFEVVKRLGAGGMAEVWQIRHLRLQLMYAMKVLTHPHPIIHKRFLLEGRLQARLRHDNVVRIYDVIELSGQPALVMEYVNGPNLFAFLEIYQPTIAHLDALAWDILSGVQVAHKAGLVHRDLKPTNILLADEGRHFTAKVADFGLARQTGPRDEALTRSGVMLGTLAYMAPEQVRDARSVDARTDIWALGCVLYEMATKRRAFGELKDSQLHLKVLSGQHHPIPDDLPARWRQAISAALQVNPDDRPQSCAALKELLQLSAKPKVAKARAGERPAPVKTTAPLNANPNPTPPSRRSTNSLSTRNNFRRPRNRFVGRHAELAALQQSLNTNRLVTILGTGGLGKSRLALEVGRTTLEAWPGGAWFIELADTRTPGGIWSAIAEVLKLSLGGNPQRQIIDALLERGRTLLILDNFEQIIDFAAETVGSILDGTTGVSVVTTSRIPLRLQGELIYALDQLEEEQAISLFVERAQQTRRREGFAENFRDDIRDLVHQLDRLPLAIELAATRSRIYTPRQLLSRLSRRFDLLRSRSRELPQRQRTLQAALSWSWDMLNATEREVLAQCSVFEGGMRLEDAAEVILVEDDTLWIEEVLADLVDKSLLVNTESRDGTQRLSMLVSVQQFASARLTEKHDAFQRHAQYFSQWSEAGSLPMSEYQRERENLLAACQRAVQLGMRDTAEDCMPAVAELFRHQGPFEEGAAYFEARIREATFTPPSSLLLRAAGTMAMLAGNMELAERHLTAAVQAMETPSPELSDRKRRLHQAMALKIFGTFRYRQGRIDEAQETYIRAVALAQQVGAEALESQVRLNLGILYHGRGRVDDALDQVNRSLQIVRRRKDLSLEGQLLTSVGVLNQEKGRTRVALDAYHQSLDIARRLGKRGSQARNLINMGTVYSEAERFEDALASHESALEIAKEIGDAELESYTLAIIGTTHLDLRHFDQAEACFHDSARLSRQIGARATERIAVAGLGHLYTEQARWAEASTTLTEALEQARQLKQPAAEATTLVVLGDLHRNQGHTKAALDAYTQALHLSESLSESKKIQIRIILAAFHRAHGEPASARPYLRQATSLVSTTSKPREVINLLCERVRLEVATRHRSAAETVFAEINTRIRALGDDVLPSLVRDVQACATLLATLDA